jgi:hypothetical protein
MWEVKMQQEYKIYDPDGMIEAYSSLYGTDLLIQRTIEIKKYNQGRQIPTESESSQLIKKVTVALS